MPKLKYQLHRVVFLGVCHSESCGNSLIQAGVDHVIAIADDNQVTNLVSRTFFSKFLSSAILGKEISLAVEDGLLEVENHKEETTAKST